MLDYISVEYSKDKRPQTAYPAKLAKYLFSRFKMKAGQSILEVGSGRCEVLQQFKLLGMQTYAIDSAFSAKEYANVAGINFELYNLSPENSIKPFNGKKFDVIFSKSFIEHLQDPLYFFEWSKNRLGNHGKIISLTPDWESNYKIFFDDITHIRPFTVESISQVLELSDYKEIEVFKFRQLPITWNNSIFLLFSKITSFFTPPRVKQKWFRWSRELMLASVGKKIDQ